VKKERQSDKKVFYLMHGMIAQSSGNLSFLNQIIFSKDYSKVRNNLILIEKEELEEIKKGFEGIKEAALFLEIHIGGIIEEKESKEGKE